jgi:hypothetical protein
MGTKGWRGMLAPLDSSTGDGRRFLSDGVTNRQLPLPLKWQREDTQGHDASVVVGSCLYINYGTVAEAIDEGWIDAKCVEPSKYAADLLAAWGAGELFDVDPHDLPRLHEDIAEATLLLGKQVIGPSVDAGSAQAVIARKGSDEPMTDAELEALFWDDTSSGDDVELEILFTEYEIAAATLVAIPAFAECRPFEILEDVAALTAAVRSSGWSGLPLAERGMAWDGTAAEKRVAEQCGIGGDSPDWGSYAEAFLYQADDADPETKQAYGFQIVDLVDGERHIVPRAVFAVAAVLQGARGGTVISQTDQDAMKTVVSGLYDRMAKEFDDDTIKAPWAEESAALLAALTAAAPAYAPALFDDPKLDRITPITITDTGEVFGHVATHDTCHVGMPGQCLTAPYSGRGYNDFHRYALPSDGGDPIQVGRITSGLGKFVCSCLLCRGSNDDHACLGLGASGSIAHHDKLTTVAWVRAGEDSKNNAIWVHGVLNPAAGVDDIASLAKARISGDWRPIGGRSELVEVLSLAKERPGFPLPRVRMLAGQAHVLTAAGVVRRAESDSSRFEIDYERLGRIVAENMAARIAAPPAAAADPERLEDAAAADPELLEDQERHADAEVSASVDEDAVAALLDEVNAATLEGDARILMGEIERMI